MDRLARMFDTHPHPASDAGEEALACVYACAECAEVCAACADACLAEDDPGALVGCIRMNADCSDVCWITGRLVARAGERDRATLEAQLRACEAACRACAEECGRHGDRMEHCAVCAEACRACAEACARMIGALVA